MLHIKLRGIEELDPATCPMGRRYNGWEPNMSEQDIYRINRGRWVLGQRADSEHFALFSADGVVRAAIGINGVASSDGSERADSDGRRALRGTVLTDDHPVHREYVGKPTPEQVAGQRNPIGYFDSPHDVRLCACGCGETVTLLRNAFVLGHDQRAIRERVNTAGGPVAFLRWFDSHWKP